MSDAKITSKGQITIPKAVRERLHLAPGDRVYFDIRNDGSVRLVARNRPLEGLFGMLHGKTKVRGISIEKMNPASDPHYDA